MVKQFLAYHPYPLNNYLNYVFGVTPITKAGLNRNTTQVLSNKKAFTARKLTTKAIKKLNYINYLIFVINSTMFLTPNFSNIRAL